MDRYWRELAICAQHKKGMPHVMEAPAWLGPPPETTSRAPTLRRNLMKRIIYPWRVRSIKADLVHVLDHSYAHLIPYVRKGIKIVATAFDLVPLEDPDGMTGAQVGRFRSAVENLKHADHIISISGETKKKLGSMLDIPAEKITVAWPGVDFAKFDTPVSPENPVARRLRALPPVIFSVGSAIKRKNLASIPSLFAPLADYFHAGRCVFVRAGEPLPQELRSAIEQVVGPEGFVELGPLFGADLVAAYQTARIFLFPSTLEGLTFTIPEAMAAGTAVLTNRCTANPEAGGDAAAYYDEGDHVMAADQLRRLLDDEAYHQQMVSRGKDRMRMLTWERHFSIVSNVYEEVLGHTMSARTASGGAI